MKNKLINISDTVAIPVPRELTPEDEAEIIAQYQLHRTLDSLEADYQDIDKQIGDGVAADQLLKELQNMHSVD